MNAGLHFAVSAVIDGGSVSVSATDGHRAAFARVPIVQAHRVRTALQDVDASVSRLLRLLEGQNT